MREAGRVERSWALVGDVVWRKVQVVFGRLKLAAGIRRCAIPNSGNLSDVPSV